MSIIEHRLDKKRGYVLNELNRLERVTRFSRIFGNASTLEDVCRSIVQADEFAGKLVGTQIHTLTRRGTFVSAAVFGMESHPETETLWLFDEHPISECAQQKGVVIKPHPANDEFDIWTMPILKDKNVAGALSSVVRTGEEIIPFNEEEMISIANLAYLFLSLSGMPEIVKNAEAAASGQLTQRQHEIVMFMAKGLTNAQIGSELILSESSIKQESVKIFKALGVENRRDAVRRARETGLIPDQNYI